MNDEPAGFREFVVARSPALLRTAYLFTGDAAAAQDLLQTALAKTWPHWHRVDPNWADAYVRRAMVRTNASWRSRRWTAEMPAGASEAIDERLHTRVDARDGEVDQRLVITSALARLPVRQRHAVVLRYCDDLSVETVADIMGSSVGTVKSQCAKGLAKLRILLNEGAETTERMREQQR